MVNHGKSTASWLVYIPYGHLIPIVEKALYVHIIYIDVLYACIHRYTWTYTHIFCDSYS